MEIGCYGKTVLVVMAPMKVLMRSQVVRERKKQEEKAEQVRRGKRHLDAFLQQSGQVLEAQQSDLAAAALARRRRSSSKSSAASEEWDSSESFESASQLSHKPTPARRTLGEGDRDLSSNEDPLDDPEDEREAARCSDEEAADLLELPAEGTSDKDEEASFNGVIPLSGAPRSPEATPRRPSRAAASRSSFPNSSVSHPIRTSPALDLGGDPVFVPDNIALTDLADREMDLEMEAGDAEEESDDEEIGGLHEDSELPIEALLLRYGYIAAGDPISPGDSNDDPNASRVASVSLAQDTAGKSSNSSTTQINHDPGDAEFDVGDVSAIDASDRLLDIEMEAVEESLAVEDSVDEIDGLEDDANVPIMEVLQRYGYLDHNPESNSQSMDLDEAPPTRDQARIGSRSQAIEDNANRRDSTSTAVHLSPHSPASDAEPQVVDAEDGLSEPSALDESDDETASRSSDSQSSKVIEQSESYIPPPFLLRGTLRPYQQAGLEWLASLHANDTNGILYVRFGVIPGFKVH